MDKKVLLDFIGFFKEQKRQHLSVKRFKQISLNGESDIYSISAFDYYKCIFIHIPKSAGISINTTLFGNLGGGHRSVQEYERIFPPKTFKTYFKFSFVRNPYTRIQSAYYFLKDGGINKYDLAWSKKYLWQVKDFEDFVLNHLSEDLMYSWHHFIPQLNYLQDESGKIPVDFIGRFENLEKDFKYVSQRVLGYEKILQIRNSSNSEYTCISDVAKEKIYKLYTQDFESFSYSK